MSLISLYRDSITTPSSAPGSSVIRSVRYGSILLARSVIATEGHLLIGTVSQYITHVDLVLYRKVERSSTI